MKRILSAIIIIFILIQPVFIAAEKNAADPNIFDPADVRGKSVILAEQKSGKVLYEKNANEKVYPASLTKNMTALLAIENLDMNEVVTVGDEIKLKESDASGAGLRIGEQIKNEDLLRALLIPSGNDASYTIAVQVARKLKGDSSLDIDEALNYFSEIMNKRAKEIGAVNSNFVNPHGYHDKNHYSTAFDQYIIAREAMKHEIFRNVVGTQVYSNEESDASAGIDSDKKVSHQWLNRNLLINEKSKYYFKPAVGIKTGYTSDSGFCLVSAATNDNLELIAVVMGEPTDGARWNDSKNLLEYGLDNFEIKTLLRKGQAVCSVNAGKRYRDKNIEIVAVSDKDYTDVLKKSDISIIKEDIIWKEELVDRDYSSKHGSERLIGPISKGQVLGKVIYSVDGKTIVESDLLAVKNELKLNILDYILYAAHFVYRHWKAFIIPVAILIVFLIAIRISMLRRKRKKRSWRYRKY